jgi:hypothetical protein
MWLATPFVNHGYLPLESIISMDGVSIQPSRDTLEDTNHVFMTNYAGLRLARLHVVRFVNTLLQPSESESITSLESWLLRGTRTKHEGRR